MGTLLRDAVSDSEEFVPVPASVPASGASVLMPAMAPGTPRAIDVSSQDDESDAGSSSDDEKHFGQEGGKQHSDGNALGTSGGDDDHDDGRDGGHDEASMGETGADRPLLSASLSLSAGNNGNGLDPPDLDADGDSASQWQDNDRAHASKQVSGAESGRSGRGKGGDDDEDNVVNEDEEHAGGDTIGAFPAAGTDPACRPLTRSIESAAAATTSGASTFDGDNRISGPRAKGLSTSKASPATTAVPHQQEAPPSPGTPHRARRKSSMGVHAAVKAL